MPSLYKGLQSISILCLFFFVRLAFDFFGRVPEQHRERQPQPEPDPQPEPPKDIFAAIASHPDLHAFSDLLDISGLNLVLSGNKNYTVFAPVSGAFSSFNAIEENYLKSGLAHADLSMLLRYHIHADHILYAGDLWWSTTIPTMQGETVSAKGHWFNSDIEVNNGKILTRDVMASNGIIQTVSTVLRPSTLKFTALKYVIGLNAGRFASLIHDVGVNYKLEGDVPITILAPCDEAFADVELPPSGSWALKKWVQYHLIAGRVTLESLNDGQMLETEVVEEELRGRKQRVKVEVKGNDVKFNQASVLVGQVHFNNVIIYIISKTLSVPPSALTQLNADPSFNSFRIAVSASNLNPNILLWRRASLFIPTNEAFVQLGLVARYLLLPEARSDLQLLIKYHVVATEHVLYSVYIPELYTSYPTLAQINLMVKNIGNGGIFARSIIQDDPDFISKVTESDILLSNGVLHAIDSVLIPPTVVIPNGGLLRAINAKTLLSIFEAAYLSSEVLSPPTGGKNGRAYTILAPSEEAFGRINLTWLFGDTRVLSHVARMHVIPMDHDPTILPLPRLLSDGAEYDTLLSITRFSAVSRVSASRPKGEDRIAIRKMNDGGFVIRAVDYPLATNAEARVVAFGRSYGRGGVIEIDQVLIPYGESPPGVISGDIPPNLSGKDSLEYVSGNILLNVTTKVTPVDDFFDVQLNDSRNDDLYILQKRGGLDPSSIMLIAGIVLMSIGCVGYGYERWVRRRRDGYMEI
ncbi:hypothetical protein BC937DRAFT_87386 [Endogone sp. FLAS-F59071]|nr:hypothetical protein BC937DRAFT_87386 [Endogone sp. FLAS-F59071]|eukprot:RUS19493.1 hypothetical protein BC937DRAFT_87386 [Endogone sp. FLAS-F59071]